MTAITCNDCQVLLSDISLLTSVITTAYTANPGKVCKSCLKQEYEKCDWTSDLYHRSDISNTGYISYWKLPDNLRENLQIWQGRTLRVNDVTLEEEFFRCYSCRDYFPEDMAIGSANSEICQGCYENYYFYCNGCDEVCHNDDLQVYEGEAYCENCYERYCESEETTDVDVLEAKAPDVNEVENYSYDVLRRLGFKGNSNDKIYFGIELETNSRSDSSYRDNARECNRLLQDYAVLKHDGSIGRGFEIVTCPATLKYHQETLTDFFSNRPDDLFVADPEEVGMHVHVSRKPLSPLTIGKMVEFINAEQNRDFVVKIAGRSSGWGKLNGKKKIKEVKKSRYDLERREAINLTNPDTIEFRLFASSVDRDTVLSRLEFTHATVYFCMQTSIQELNKASFCSWLEKQPRTRYKQLLAYLKNM